MSGKRLDEKNARAQEKDGEQKKSHEIAKNNKIRAETENQIKNFVFFLRSFALSFTVIQSNVNQAAKMKRHCIWKQLRFILSQQIWNIALGEWFVKWKFVEKWSVFGKHVPAMRHTVLVRCLQSTDRREQDHIWKIYKCLMYTNRRLTVVKQTLVISHSVLDPRSSLLHYSSQFSFLL